MLPRWSLRVFGELGKTIGNSRDTCPFIRALCYLSIVPADRSTASRNRRKRARQARGVKSGRKAETAYECQNVTRPFINNHNYHQNHRDRRSNKM